mgnify:CR=1 FL=1
MRKAIALLTLLALIFSGVSMNPEHSEASSRSLEKLQQDRQVIKDKLSDKEQEIAQVLDEINAIHKQMTLIEEELDENNKKIEDTEVKILEYEEQFYVLLDEINELNKTIEKRNDILKNRLAAYQESGGDISFLEVILNAKSFTEFISRVASVTAITKADRELIQLQMEDREKLEEHQNAIVEKIEKQEKLMKQLEETKKVINEQKKALKKYAEELKQKESQLTNEKQKLANEDNKLKQLEQSYRSEMNQREQQRNGSKNTKTVASTASKPNKKTEVGETYRMVATAYTPFCRGCSGVTSTGINVKGKQHQRIIAVDPNVIPLGTKVWVEGYGEAIAADTGSSIKGNKIDVLFKSQNQALQWGRKTVTVKVLK